MTGQLTERGLYVDELESDEGPGSPLVVIVHGSMDRHTSFARIRSRLMARYAVLSYDRRGYALSRDATPRATGMADHIDDLEAIVDGRRCTLVGHSYGGDVVLALSERRPDIIASALVYEPPLAWLDWWPSHGEQPPRFRDVTGEQAAEDFLRRMVGDHRYERLPLHTREEIVKDGDALVVELTAIRLDPPPFDPARIEIPVLVVCGGDSDERHQNSTSLLASELPAGSLHHIEGADHGGHQSHPAELAGLIAGTVALGLDPKAERPPARV